MARFVNHIEEKTLAKAISITFMLLGAVMIIIRFIETHKIVP